MDAGAAVAAVACDAASCGCCRVLTNEFERLASKEEQDDEWEVSSTRYLP